MNNGSIENEMKYIMPNFDDIDEIYKVLSCDYIIYPYDKTLLYDYYYDTADYQLLRNGFSYRIRNKLNRSINFKTKGELFSGILSRVEYRDAVDKSCSMSEILQMNCGTNSIVKSVLNIHDLILLRKACVLCANRTSFLLYYKDGNEIKKFGVCSFDSYFEIEQKVQHYEVEIEACEEILASNIFMHFISIKSKLDKYGLKNSSTNKYTISMKDVGVL